MLSLHYQTYYLNFTSCPTNASESKINKKDFFSGPEYSVGFYVAF